MEKITNAINLLINKLKLGAVVSQEQIFGGLINKMYKVETSSGIFAIKLLNSDVIKSEYGVSNHILAETISEIAKENGINTITAIRFDGEFIQRVDNNCFLIFNWFDGKPLKTKDITMKHIKDVAMTLAKLHSIDYGEIKSKCHQGIEIIDTDWNYYIDKVKDEDVKKLLLEHKEKLYYLDKKSSECMQEINHFQVVSHRDLDLPNILWNSNNELAIIDWESAGLINPTQEFFETAWDWCGGHKDFDIEKYDLFYKTYQDNGGLLLDVEKALYADFKAKSSWLEFNLKRLIDNASKEEFDVGKKESLRMIKEIFDFYNIFSKIYSFELNI